MTATVRPGSTGDAAWQRHLGGAAAGALAGVLIRLAGPGLPTPVAAIGLGVGLTAASFMLAWAADAGEAVFSGGRVLIAVALIAVLPEFLIEVHLAFTQQAELVTANLTGATRLLLTCAVGLPLAVGLLGRRAPGVAAEPIRLAGQRRLELGILLIVALYAVQILVKGRATVLDGIVLLGLYVLYVGRVQGTVEEEPAVVGVGAGLLSLSPHWRRPAVATLILVAGAVVVATATPFTTALLDTGRSLGVDPYLLIQSVVPATTEAPELMVVAVLVVNRRPAQGLAVLLASSVSQWTLGLGSLPIAYLAGGGGPSLPMAGREQLEVGFTMSLTLFAVAALATLEPTRVDAVLIAVVFTIQLVYPTPFIRFAATLVLLAFAVDLLAARWRHAGPVIGAVLRPVRRPRHERHDDQPCAGQHDA